jgi:AcrR family transcriptional regulator
LPPDGEPAAPGLRERKKVRTRAAIQRHALRLFRERGYEATTVNQIAEAAEVSVSTFFRYFPTKEDVVLFDEFDPRIFDLIRSAPPGPSTLQVVRDAMRQVLSGLSQAELAEQRERMELVLSDPPLRAAVMDRFGIPMRGLAEAVAGRAGRSPDDPAVRALVGAVIGVGLSATFAAMENPDADLVALLLDAFDHLDEGLRL